MADFDTHTRYAVQVPTGWCGRNTGHDWQTGKPGYEIVQGGKNARLFTQKAAATKAANVLGGKVVPVSVSV